MIRIDRRIGYLPGKAYEAVAQAKREAEFISENTDVSAPARVFTEFLGDVNTIHLVLEYESLAAYENSVKRLREHQEWRQLLSDGGSVFVPGSVRDTATIPV